MLRIFWRTLVRTWPQVDDRRPPAAALGRSQREALDVLWQAREHGVHRAAQRSPPLAMHEAQREHTALATRQHVLLDQRSDLGGLKRVQVELTVNRELDLLAVYLDDALVVRLTRGLAAQTPPFGCVILSTRSSSSFEYTRPTRESRAFFCTALSSVSPCGVSSVAV